MAEGIVYVLVNPAMPGLVKIGMTSRESPQVRMGELYSTGVPVPFHCVFACRVRSADEAENALHIAFGPQRINPQREFFQIEPEQAMAILKLLSTEDVTPAVRREELAVDEESREASVRLERARRPNLNFIEMNIPIGSILKSVHGDEEAEVVEPKRVRFRGEITSITNATQQVLQLPHGVAPGPHWTFQGRTLREIYDETYGYSA